MHLYVHVPFCARRCSYCDFAIAVRKRIPAQEYVDCVRRELALRAPGAEALDTLYLGGGTPSLLGPEALALLLAELVRAFGLSHGGEPPEVTIEANPEDVTPEAAAGWRGAGVNRVSLGTQSFDDTVLRWMHRVHDAARNGAAVRTLRAAGFENISLDLIFALPQALDRDWSRDLECALALEPAHLSLYGLTVEDRTPLARWISRGAIAAPDDERYAEEYLLAHERLGAAGYRFYEVSNAARDARWSRHNAAYWSGRAYLGLGPAAHSYDGRARRWNVAQWEEYRRALGQGTLPVAAEEHLSAAERELEHRYLALRTERGIGVTDIAPERLARWVERGWGRLVGDRVRCTAEGWLRLDALVGDLTELPATV